MRGHLIRYRYKGASPSSSYSYQRFFRALYGYTQVVTKSNGKTYVYYREGVLTRYPYIRSEKNTVIIPENAFTPLVEFFKTGKNPAHSFENLDDWSVTYYVEDVPVDEASALKAIYLALNRIILRTPSTIYRLRDLAQKDVLDPDELSALRYGAEHIVASSWFKELYEKDPLLSRLNEHYLKAQQTLL